MLTSACFREMTLELFAKNAFLDMGQISSDLVKKAFATWQLTFLSTSVAFYDIVARACAQMKSKKVFSIETCNFLPCVTTCSGRKFCSDFFTHLLENFCTYLRLHRAELCDTSYGCNGAKFERPRRQRAWHNKEKWSPPAFYSVTP